MKKKESQVDVMARHIADIHQQMPNFATKNDIKNLREEIRGDIHDLEVKLIEDTGAVIGTEQKHFHSQTQRIARLEKEVFDKNATA